MMQSKSPLKPTKKYLQYQTLEIHTSLMADTCKKRDAISETNEFRF